MAPLGWRQTEVGRKLAQPDTGLLPQRRAQSISGTPG